MIKKKNTVRPLGILEEKVMGVLWQNGPLSVREVNQYIEELSLAHTTVMTTLDRLFKKGMLSREKNGIAYIYRAAFTEHEYQQRLVETTVSGLMKKNRDAEPMLAAFVDAAVELDEANLAKLEAMIADRKRRGE